VFLPTSIKTNPSQASMKKAELLLREVHVSFVVLLLLLLLLLLAASCSSSWFVLLVLASSGLM
jgi:hypothetical protein